MTIVYFVSVVATIVVAVAHPYTGHTLFVEAFKVILRTLFGLAANLVLASRTILVAVTFSLYGYTKSWAGLVALALELFAETSVVLAVLFIRPVSTVVVSVANLNGKYTVRVFALKLPRPTLERRTLGWLVGTISTVVLAITLPPERNAFEGGGALEGRLGTVGFAAQTVLLKNKVLRTLTLTPRLAHLSARHQKTKGLTASVVFTRIGQRQWLTQRMKHLQVHGVVYCLEDGLVLLAAVLVAPFN